MAFARWSKESDVYVYLDVAGYLLCCGCAFEHPGRFFTTAEMLEHLAEHRRAGHMVPDSCDERLRAEQDQIDRRIAELRKPEPGGV